MKETLEALAVCIGGIVVLLLVLALVAGSWWLVGWLAMLVWSATLGPAPVAGWQCGLLLFTAHIVLTVIWPTTT